MLEDIEVWKWVVGTVGLLAASGGIVLSVVGLRARSGRRKSPAFSKFADMSPPEVALDLDMILIHPITIRILGRGIKINPVDVETYAEITEFLGKIDGFRRTGTDSLKPVIDTYWEIFRRVTDDLTKNDLGQMSVQQCAAFLQGVTDYINGRFVYDEKKKRSFYVEREPSKSQTSASTSPGL